MCFDCCFNEVVEFLLQIADSSQQVQNVSNVFLFVALCRAQHVYF